MKKLFLTGIIVGIVMQLNAQVNPAVPIQKARVISPAKVVVIRNDLSGLKIRGAQICDSLGVLQNKIADMIKALQSGGTPDETIDAMVKQKKMDQVTESMAWITALMKRMNDMAQSIIQNLK